MNFIRYRKIEEFSIFFKEQSIIQKWSILSQFSELHRYKNAITSESFTAAPAVRFKTPHFT